MATWIHDCVQEHGEALPHSHLIIDNIISDEILNSTYIRCGESMSLEYIVYAITTRCNLGCPGCFRVGRICADVPVNLFNEVILNLKDLGCERLNISGGEPLLHKYVWDIIKITVGQGIHPLLSTNGLLLSSMDDSRLDSLAVVSLPLDAATPDLNDTIRCQGHFDHIMNLISEYLQSDKKFVLKINTIVFQENVSHLHDILAIVNHDRIIWKLFQYAPRGTFATRPRLMGLEDNLFEEVVGDIAATPGVRCRITALGADKAMNYIIVDPEGHVHLPTRHEYSVLGNISDPKVIELLANIHSNSL